MDLITVIVPVYKVEKYLRRCVDSILAQTYTNLEIILVDDGSPDNCGKICDEYAAKDSRIKVIHQENGGLSAARNAGLDIATGDYIGFVDSDDYIAPDMYEKLYAALKESDADISICNFQKVDENGKKLKTKEKIESGVLTNMQALTELQGKSGLCFIVAWNKLYKSWVFDGVRFPVGRKCEDNYIAHILIHKSRKVALVEEELHCYLQREGSIMKGNSLEFSSDEIDGFICRRNYFINNKLFEFILDSEKNIIGSYRRQFIKTKNRKALKKKYGKKAKKMYLDIKSNCSWKDHMFYFFI